MDDVFGLLANGVADTHQNLHELQNQLVQALVDKANALFNWQRWEDGLLASGVVEGKNERQRDAWIREHDIEANSPPLYDALHDATTAVNVLNARIAAARTLTESYDRLITLYQSRPDRLS